MKINKFSILVLFALFFGSISFARGGGGGSSGSGSGNLCKPIVIEAQTKGGGGGSSSGNGGL